MGGDRMAYWPFISGLAHAMLEGAMIDWLSNLQHASVTNWHGLGGETKAAIISAIATLGAASAGFGAIVWQIRSQGRQGRTAIFETERRKLKAAMYEEAVSVCRSMADTAIDLSTMLRTMMMHVEVASQAHVAGLSYQMPPTRFPKLAASYGAFSDATLRFIFMVENRRIVDPRIIVFRTAMNTILHDTRDLMYSKFVVHVMPTLPVEGPDGSLYPYTPPSIEGATAVRNLAETFIGSLDDATAYADDFLVEMQNHLLGDLFGTQLIHRQPPDTSNKVIRLDQFETLEAWFWKETPWGQTGQRVEAEVRARFAQPVSGPPL
jgi:hypothetical protein